MLSICIHEQGIHELGIHKLGIHKLGIREVGIMLLSHLKGCRNKGTIK